MLEKLIEITNSEAYMTKGYLIIKEVVARQENFELKISYEIEDRHKDLIQYEGVIFCEGHWTSNRVEEIKFPYNRIKFYPSHPALWESGNKLYVNVEAPNTNVAELLGDLYMVHVDACGNWADFHRLFCPIPQGIKTAGGTTIAIPESLFGVYEPILWKHQVIYSITEKQEGRHNHSLFLFSNPANCADNFYLLQPYIIAEKFTVTVNEVNRPMANPF